MKKIEIDLENKAIEIHCNSRYTNWFVDSTIEEISVNELIKLLESFKQYKDYKVVFIGSIEIGGLHSFIPNGFTTSGILSSGNSSITHISNPLTNTI
jgi:hypothetical protein